jgi:probable HAF family extracellular repeat protein
MIKIRFGMWAAMVLVLAPLAGAQSYSVTNMGDLGGGESLALAINDHGAAVGYSYLTNGDQRAFIWTSAGGMHNLGNLDGSSALSTARGINNSGQVAGLSYLSNGDVHPFLWTKAGGMQDLGTLGGTYAVGNAINDSGEVVGNSFLANGTSQHAFVWTAAVGMQDIGTLGGEISSAQGINDSGEVVGFSYLADGVTNHAFLWTQSGGMQDLGTLGGQDSAAYAVSATGGIVGSADNTSSVAFLWTSVHGMRTLNAGYQSLALAVNASEQVVGVNSLGVFLWTTSQHEQNLNSLIPPQSGWVLSLAYGINRSGQIAATGQTRSGTYGALLTPTN